MADQKTPEDPSPDENRTGDMGEGSFQDSQDRGKSAPPSRQGPRRVPVPKQRPVRK